jgi:hypothetical protein
MSYAIASLCLALAALGFVKYEADAPLLSATTFAVVLVAYLAARRMRAATPVLR